MSGNGSPQSGKASRLRSRSPDLEEVQREFYLRGIEFYKSGTEAHHALLQNLELAKGIIELCRSTNGMVSDIHQQHHMPPSSSPAYSGNPFDPSSPDFLQFGQISAPFVHVPQPPSTPSAPKKKRGRAKGVPNRPKDPNRPQTPKPKAASPSNLFVHDYLQEMLRDFEANPKPGEKRPDFNKARAVVAELKLWKNMSPSAREPYIIRAREKSGSMTPMTPMTPMTSMTPTTPGHEYSDFQDENLVGCDGDFAFKATDVIKVPVEAQVTADSPQFIYDIEPAVDSGDQLEFNLDHAVLAMQRNISSANTNKKKYRAG